MDTELVNLLTLILVFIIFIIELGRLLRREKKSAVSC
jgi:hypothetical protein